MYQADRTMKVWCQAGKGRLNGGPKDPDTRPYKSVRSTLGVLVQPVRVYNYPPGEWVEVHGRTETIFGLCTPDGYFTHMHYSDAYGPSFKEAIDRIRSCEPNPESRYWYFDAGGNGYPIRIKLDLLETALKELGLLND